VSQADPTDNALAASQHSRFPATTPLPASAPDEEKAASSLCLGGNAYPDGPGPMARPFQMDGSRARRRLLRR